jgi:hypothetical protein
MPLRSNELVAGPMRLAGDGPRPIPRKHMRDTRDQLPDTTDPSAGTNRPLGEPAQVAGAGLASLSRADSSVRSARSATTASRLPRDSCTARCRVAPAPPASRRPSA